MPFLFSWLGEAESGKRFFAQNKNGEVNSDEFTSPKKDGKQLHRIAQQPTLAAFLPWGGLAGADRVALAGGKGSKKLYPCLVVIKIEIQILKRPVAPTLLLKIKKISIEKNLHLLLPCDVSSLVGKPWFWRHFEPFHQNGLVWNGLLYKLLSDFLNQFLFI